MPNGPDVPADIAHEESVRVFMASLPKRRRERVEAKYPVLEERHLRRISQAETLWDPWLLDLVESSGLPIHRSPLKAEPSFHVGRLSPARGI